MHTTAHLIHHLHVEGHTGMRVCAALACIVIIFLFRSPLGNFSFLLIKSTLLLALQPPAPKTQAKRNRRPNPRNTGPEWAAGTNLV
jgi:hypothetical protein